MVACLKYGVSRTTLSKWAAETGKIQSIKTGGDAFNSGHRYNAADLAKYFKLPPSSSSSGIKTQKKTIIYARVSSSKQEASGDLSRQIEILKTHCPSYDLLITDVAASGRLNFKRRGLTRLLDQVEVGNVSKIVVSYSDRLVRFGLDLLKRTFRQYAVTLDVVSSNAEQQQQQQQPDQQTELAAEDLLAVCNFFVAKNNNGSLRAASNARNRRKKLHKIPI